jgi:hypothetical protein
MVDKVTRYESLQIKFATVNDNSLQTFHGGEIRVPLESASTVLGGRISETGYFSVQCFAHYFSVSSNHYILKWSRSWIYP